MSRLIDADALEPEIIAIYYDTFTGECVKTIEDIAPPERYIPITKTENGVYIEKWEVLKDGKILRLNVAFQERDYYDKIYHDGIMNGMFEWHKCTPVRLIGIGIPENKFKGYAGEGAEQE